MRIEIDDSLPWRRVENALVSAGLELRRVDAMRWVLRARPTNYVCHLCRKEVAGSQALQIGKEILCIPCYNSQRG